jgi:hypothetical protein
MHQKYHEPDIDAPTRASSRPDLADPRMHTGRCGRAILPQIRARRAARPSNTASHRRRACARMGEMSPPMMGIHARVDRKDAFAMGASAAVVGQPPRRRGSHLADRVAPSRGRLSSERDDVSGVAGGPIR